MSFQSALFLLALPLLAIPVLLHFFRRRQTEVVHWAAMEFLTDAVTKVRRLERLEELLVMLLRAAAILALVLALARPMVRGHWLGVSPAREVVLVIDDSLSTSRITGGGTTFDDVRAQALEIVGSVTEEDALHVMLAAAGPRWMTTGAIHPHEGLAELIGRIGDLQPTNATADFFSCLNAAVNMPPTAGAMTRRIVVLADRQAYGWQTDAETAWQQLAAAAKANELPTTVEVLTLGPEADAPINLVVTRLETERTLVTPGESFQLTAEIKNVGTKASRDNELAWFVAGKSLGTSAVPELGPGATKVVHWSHELPDEGAYELTCQLRDDDDVHADDQAGVIVEAVTTLPILLVQQSAPQSGRRLSSLQFLTSALGYDGARPEGDWQSLYRPGVVSADDLSRTNLSSYRAIVLLDVAMLPGSSHEQLAEFVTGGGGLWITLGDNTKRETFNATWYDEGAGLAPLPIGRLLDRTGREEPAARVHPPSATHPALTHLADTDRLDIDQVEISRYFRLDTSRQPEIRVLLETGTGHPLAVEHFLGRGRIILQSHALDHRWSNLPRTKSFVVMVHDWLNYLSQPAATEHNLQSGAPLVWRPGEQYQHATATLTTPAGRAIELSSHARPGGAEFRCGQTDLPGSYTLTLHGNGVPDKSIPYWVPRDPAESHLAPLTTEQIAKLDELADVQFVSRFSNRSTDLPRVPNEKPIWWPLLLALVLLVAAELAFASRAAGERYAMPTTG